MFKRAISLWLPALLSVQGLQVEHSKQYPLGSEVENLVVRPSGSVLTTVYTFPRLYEVEPQANATPRLIHTFQNTHGACGIAEGQAYDEYYVATGNFSFDTFTPAANSYAIHHLSFDKANKAVVKQLATLDEIQQVNGICSVPNTPLVLLADSLGGFVWQFNAETRELRKYFDSPLLKPQQADAPVLFGVNGIKLWGGYLYFSNSNLEIVARIKASGSESCLEGEPEIVAKDAPVDDFILDERNGDIYAAEQGTINGVGYVSHKAYGSVPKTIVGGPNSTLLGPTATQWAKGAMGKTLLVTVTGGFLQFNSHNYTGGGELAIIHLQ